MALRFCKETEVRGRQRRIFGFGFLKRHGSYAHGYAARQFPARQSIAFHQFI